MTKEEINKLAQRLQDIVWAISPLARAHLHCQGMGVHGMALAVTLGVKGSSLENIAQMQLGVQMELMKTIPGGVTWTLCVAQV